MSEDDRAKLAQQREQWDEQDRTIHQEDQDEQIARQLQAGEQQRADHPIQLGPVKGVLSTEEKMARTQQVFSQFAPGDEDEDEDEPIGVPVARREE